jgi:hypothetical protein
MKTMDKQKTKYGIIEIMPNGKIYGYVNVSKMTPEREQDVLSEYLDLGYIPMSNTYTVVGGGLHTIDYKYIDEDGVYQEDDLPYLNHGIITMKTKLKVYVPTKD